MTPSQRFETGHPLLAPAIGAFGIGTTELPLWVCCRCMLLVWLGGRGKVATSAVGETVVRPPGRLAKAELSE